MSLHSKPKKTMLINSDIQKRNGHRTVYGETETRVSYSLRNDGENGNRAEKAEKRADRDAYPTFVWQPRNNGKD